MMINSNPYPLVSVIIPAYNAQEFISQTIDSILAQTYLNIEIIVVDDGSVDRTSQIVHGYKNQVRYYYQDNSGGCAVPRNIGIKNSFGELLCFNDADDLMVPDRLEIQVDFLLRYPGVGLVFSDYRNFSDKKNYLSTHFETCPNLQLYLNGKTEIIIDNACPYLAKENFGIASSFLMRRILLLKESGFDPSLKSSEDFNFYYRLARHTSVGVINKVGMMRRLHTFNMSSNTEKMMSECIRSYTLLLESEPDDQARYFLRKFIAYFWSNLSYYNTENGQYTTALKQEKKALYADFSMTRLYLFIKRYVRIFLIKFGFYKPRLS